VSRISRTVATVERGGPQAGTIVMKNLSILPHAIAINGNGIYMKGKVVPKGATSTLTATLSRAWGQIVPRAAGRPASEPASGAGRQPH
jgi:hypothetical protein